MRPLFILALSALIFTGCSKAPAGGAPTAQKLAVANSSGEQLCRRDLAKHVQFKDPESVRINSIKASGHTVEHYDMSVSAKNSYGGYGNPMECSCIAEPENDRLRYAFCGDPK